MPNEDINMSDSIAVVKTNGKILKAFYADDAYWGDRHQDEVIFVLSLPMDKSRGF